MIKGVDHTLVRVDDILVTGATDEEHMANLSQILSILKENGLRLRKSKCVFMVPEVQYLGYVVSKEGVRPSDDKLKAI